MSEEGKDKYLTDYFNRINPPVKELTDGQKLSRDPKGYLDEYIKNYFKDNENQNEDDLER